MEVTDRERRLVDAARYVLRYLDGDLLGTADHRISSGRALWEALQAYDALPPVDDSDRLRWTTQGGSRDARQHSTALAECKRVREEYARLNLQAAERIAQLERQLTEKAHA